MDEAYFWVRCNDEGCSATQHPDFLRSRQYWCGEYRDYTQGKPVLFLLIFIELKYINDMVFHGAVRLRLIMAADGVKYF